jgi:hypothetical protein
MLFKSPIFSQASGSLAGITFSHNRGGQYTRQRSTPTNPNSTGQQTIRSALSQAVAAWKNSLTAANRESWDTYAVNTVFVNKLGDNVFLTGQQQWIRTSVVAYQIGQDPVTLYASAPTTYDLGDTGTLTLSDALDSNVFSFTIGNSPAWAGDTGGNLIAFAGIDVSPTRQFYKAPFRFVDAVPGEATPITQAVFDYSDAYPSRVLTVGNKLFVRSIVLQSDGRLSRGQINSVLVTAS